MNFFGLEFFRAITLWREFTVPEEYNFGADLLEEPEEGTNKAAIGLIRQLLWQHEARQENALIRLEQKLVKIRKERETTQVAFRLARTVFED